MSTLKLALGIWLMPLPISLIVICTGLLLKLTGRRRIARGLIGGGVIFALAATLGPIANGLLGPLETRYPAVLDASTLASAPRYVAVLGSGYYPRDALPVTAALDGVGVVRLAEGIRLFPAAAGRAAHSVWWAGSGRAADRARLRACCRRTGRIPGISDSHRYASGH